MLRKLEFLVLFLSINIVAGCAKFDEITCDRCYTPDPKFVYEQHSTLTNDQDVIVLQNLDSRIVVTCYTSERNPAEFCAQSFEKLGYVRLRDIPYKTADFDFLKTDTYPSRRWRAGELTPRW